MSQELVYTSAPKGLKPGTRGFCTVAMTQGMPPQLIERLESLSGYRQVFAPQDPQAALNPVVQSHLRISVAGRSYHVLSRICAAGVDYSQRANKFAHHLVLDASEMPAAGPAWALQQPGLMETSWDGATKILPAGRRCPAGNTNPAVCRAWQQAAGDAGWGGVLAETAIDKSKSIVTIIYRPGLDPLPLIAESLALLPPDVRRNVSFSTYYTKLPPGVECQWRCVLEGSPESKGTPGLVINLCRPLPAAQGGKFVAAARTGKLPQSAAPAPRLPTRAERPDDLELEHLLQPEDIPSPRRGGRPFVPAATGDLTLEALPPSLPDDLDTSSAVSTQLPRRKPRLKEPARWPFIAVAAAILLIVFSVVGAITIFWRSQPIDKIAQSGPPPKISDAEEQKGEKKVQPAGKPDNANIAKGAQPVPAAPSGASSAQPKRGTDRHDPGAAKPVAKGPAENGNAGNGGAAVGAGENGDHQQAAANEQKAAEEAARKAQDDAQAALLNKALEKLPAIAPLPKQGPFSEPDGSWPLTLPSEARIESIDIFGGKKLAGGFHISVDPRESEIPPHWDVILGNDNPVTSVNSTIATFRRTNDKLTFLWGSNSIPQGLQLENCVIRLSLSEAEAKEKRVIALRRPILREPIRFSTLFDTESSRLFTIEPPPAADDARPSVEFFLRGATHSHVIKKTPIKPPFEEFSIDGRVYLRTRVSAKWDELVVEYLGAEVSCDIPDDEHISQVIPKSAARTKVTTGQLEKVLEFLARRIAKIDSDIAAEKEKEKSKDAKEKEVARTAIETLRNEKKKRTDEQDRFTSLLAILDDIKESQVGYRVFFSVKIGDHETQEVNLVRSEDGKIASQENTTSN